MSIPRQHRLRKHSEFELVYRDGRRHFSPLLTAFYLLQEDTAGASAEDKLERKPQVGITVGRALGKARVRNRIKRRVRAAVTQHLGLLSRAVDVVINPKKVVLTVDYQQLSTEIARAFDVIQDKAVVGGEQEKRNLRRRDRVVAKKS
jgi:ribonuclease P protein component